MRVNNILEQLLAGQSLTEAQAEAVMAAIMRGELTPAQMAGLLVALRAKGETVDEIVGFARAMRRAARPVVTARRPLVDTCGTGGDRSGSFNISTAVAFVVAGAGLAVAKHGNRSVSSRSGSADVLQALGIFLGLEPADMARALDEVGIAFLFAPRLHPAMRHAVGPRRELGIRTVFNLLGPLTNPARATHQLMGVFSPAWVRPLAQVLQALGLEAALVVHGDGLDEFTLSGPNRIAYFRGAGPVVEDELDPAALGLPPAPREALAGGTPEENARLLLALLRGEVHGPPRDVVLLNAAAALWIAGQARDWQEGIAMARYSLDSGAAWRVLEAYRRFTQSVAENTAKEMASPL